MCGIAGILSSTPPVSIDDITAMTMAMRHRGPDDGGTYVRGGVGLGHRRLSIIDLSPLGRQPMVSGDGRRVIVFNGEIYNFQELRRQLIRQGHRFHGQSDTEVILAAYEEYGSACLGHLRGMFSFAIWDDSAQVLFVARDRLGKKPLYYYGDGERFAFASELSSLLRLPWIPTELDVDAICSYFALQYVPGPATVYRRIRKLPPGHFAIVHAFGARCHIERYWQADRGSRRTVDDPLATVQQLLAESVKLRLIADVDVGVLLSGGLDSSLIAALAAQHSHKPIKTFSVTFQDRELNEGPYADIVANRLGADHRHIIADDVTPETLEQVIAHLDEPLADPACIPTFIVARLAAAHVKVVLTGEGADELFGGYRYYRWEQIITPLFLLPLSLRRTIASTIGELTTRTQRATARFIKVLESSPDASVVRWVTIFGSRDRRRYFSDAFRLATDDVDPLSPIYEIVRHSPACDARERGLSLDLQSWLPDDLLVKVDRMTMANSLEARAPYLDQELVEYVTSCRSPLKCTAFRTKILLKRLGLRYLPGPIVERRKHGFEVPIVSWLLRNFRELTEECFSYRVLKEIEFLNPHAVQAAWRLATGGNANVSPRHLWALFLFIQWYRRHRTAVSHASHRPVSVGQ